MATGDTAPYEHFQTHRQAVYAPILYGRTFGKEKFPLTYVKIWKCLRKYPTWGLKVGMLKYEATESTFQGEFLRAAYAGQRGLRVSVGGGPPQIATHGALPAPKLVLPAPKQVQSPED